MVSQDSIPQDVADAIRRNYKRKKRYTSDTRKQVQDRANSRISIPSLTMAEAQKQTTPKMDEDFEAVFSRLIGKVAVKETGKNPKTV